MQTKLTRKMWSGTSVAIVLALVFAPVMLAAELVTTGEVETETPNEVWVTQGMSETFKISLSATGSIKVHSDSC